MANHQELWVPKFPHDNKLLFPQTPSKSVQLTGEKSKRIIEQKASISKEACAKDIVLRVPMIQKSKSARQFIKKKVLGRSLSLNKNKHKRDAIQCLSPPREIVTLKERQKNVKKRTRHIVEKHKSDSLQNGIPELVQKEGEFRIKKQVTEKSNKDSVSFNENLQLTPLNSKHKKFISSLEMKTSRTPKTKRRSPKSTWENRKQLITESPFLIALKTKSKDKRILSPRLFIKKHKKSQRIAEIQQKLEAVIQERERQQELKRIQKKKKTSPKKKKKKLLSKNEEGSGLKKNKANTVTTEDTNHENSLETRRVFLKKSQQNEYRINDLVRNLAALKIQRWYKANSLKFIRKYDFNPNTKEKHNVSLVDYTLNSESSAIINKGTLEYPESKDHFGLSSEQNSFIIKQKSEGKYLQDSFSYSIAADTFSMRSRDSIDSENHGFAFMDISESLPHKSHLCSVGERFAGYGLEFPSFLPMENTIGYKERFKENVVMHKDSLDDNSFLAKDSLEENSLMPKDSFEAKHNLEGKTLWSKDSFEEENIESNELNENFQNNNISEENSQILNKSPDKSSVAELQVEVKDSISVKSDSLEESIDLMNHIERTHSYSSLVSEGNENQYLSALHSDSSDDLVSQAPIEQIPKQSSPKQLKFSYETFDSSLFNLIKHEIFLFTSITSFKIGPKDVDPGLSFIQEYINALFLSLSALEDETMEIINTPAYQDPLAKLEALQSSDCLTKSPSLELILPPDLSGELKLLFKVSTPSQSTYCQMIFDCINESLNNIRPFGLKGLPDPWSPISSTLYGEAQLKVVFQKIFKFVSQWQCVKSGPIFEGNKQDEDDFKKLTDEREDMVVWRSIQEEERSWRDYEDEEAQMKVFVADGVFELVVGEAADLLNRFDII